MEKFLMLANLILKNPVLVPRDEPLLHKYMTLGLRTGSRSDSSSGWSRSSSSSLLLLASGRPCSRPDVGGAAAAL